MAIVTPLLDHLKRQKQTKTILLHKVDEWLIENEQSLDNFTEDDFEVLRKLVVIGTKRDRRVFSPSGATNCSRQQVIDKLGFKGLDYRNPRTLRILDDGRWRHLRWQMIFWKMGIVTSLEQFAKDGDLEYGGSIDVIVKLRYRGKNILLIIDVKGTHASQFNSIKETKQPLIKHVIQLQIYLHLHPDTDFALLWYENKNTNEVAEVIVKRNNRIMHRALRRQRYMQRYVEANAIPKEECVYGDPRDRRFNNCPQRANCGRLPVHLIREGEILKIADPRKSSKDPPFVSYNQLPLKQLRGSLGERARPSDKSKT